MSIKIYDVYDPKTGELIAKGTTAECAEQLGIGRSTFNDRVREGSKKYQIVEVTDDVVKKWDELTEKLREMYGVPVHRAKKGAR